MGIRKLKSCKYVHDITQNKVWTTTQLEGLTPRECLKYAAWLLKAAEAIESKKPFLLGGSITNSKSTWLLWRKDRLALLKEWGPKYYPQAYVQSARSEGIEERLIEAEIRKARKVAKEANLG